MALADEVKSRYGGSSSAFLIGLTNPQNPDAGSIDDAQLTRACTDVQADFKTYAGMEFDTTLATADQQIATAVQCVIARLKLYTGNTVGAEAEVERTTKALVAMAKTIARNRFLAKTKSGTTASEENPNSVADLRPEMDSSKFIGYVPDDRGQDPGSVDGRAVGW